MNQEEKSGRSAGEMLRKLRGERGLTQEELGGSAGVSERTIIRIERGKKHEVRSSTMALILRTLDEAQPIDYLERKAILDRLHLTEDVELPDQHAIDSAIAKWRETPVYKDLSMPAYLVDVAQRIHDINALAKAFLRPGASEAESHGLTVFDLMFRPEDLTSLTIIDDDGKFFHKLVRHMRNEFAVFDHLDWCQTCIKEARERYPELDKIWTALEVDPPEPYGAREVGPLTLKMPNGTSLTFNLTGNDMQDARFRIVVYSTEDTATFMEIGAFRRALLDR